MSEHAPSPRDGEAAEYVLGTLPAAERDAFVRELVTDPGLRALVQDWEERLAPLAEGIASVTPSAALWPAIVAATVEPGGATVVGLAAATAEIARLKRSRSVWRTATTLAGAMAASLALFIVSEPSTPPMPAAGLVAVVNRSGELPALIVRVDPRAGIVQVRALGAETPADRSLELWSIVSGEAPRSLGLVAQGLAKVSLPAQDRPRLDGATIAVTVEQPGGSPDGTPKGPVVYSGKLVSENP